MTYINNKVKDQFPDITENLDKIDSIIPEIPGSWGIATDKDKTTIPKPEQRRDILRDFHTAAATIRASVNALDHFTEEAPTNFNQLKRENSLISTFFRSLADLIDESSHISQPIASAIHKKGKSFISGFTAMTPVNFLVQAAIKPAVEFLENPEGVPKDWQGATV